MLKLLADDPEELDDSYQKWQTGAERVLKELNGKPGIRPVKLPVDVETLRRWCREKGKRLDGAARPQFIAEIVKTGAFDA